MNILENIKISLEGLRLNKMRTFLTMLGIIIGIASVITIVTMGDALTNSVNKEFSSLANSSSIIVMTSSKVGYTWSDIKEKDKLHVDMIEKFKGKFKDDVKAVVVQGAGESGSVVNGQEKSSIYIESINSGGKDVYNLKLLKGRFLTDDEIIENRKVCVISDKVVKEVFKGDYDKVLGSQIDIDTSSHGIKTYTVTGIYKYETPNQMFFGGGETTTVYIPYTVGNREFARADRDTDYTDSFVVIAKDRESIPTLSTKIEKFFNENYYEDNDHAYVTTTTFESQLSMVTNVLTTISLVVGGIAAISLLVGGIGVMNILLVSVTERTREIGIRKALGATNKDIRWQFITESMIICAIGGAIGVILGSVIGYAISVFMGAATLPSIISIIVAVAFSMTIGIFFGYYPANKAAKLNPIDALRYE